MKYLLIPILICNLSFCFGQDSSAIKQYTILKKIIWRNIPDIPRYQTNNLPELFIIDIKLDEQTDSIINIDFFRKSTSVHYACIQASVERIRKEWKPGKLNLQRILIPVFLVFEIDDNTPVYDYPFPIAEGVKNKVYFTPQVILPVFSTKY